MYIWLTTLSYNILIHSGDLASLLTVAAYDSLPTLLSTIKVTDSLQYTMVSLYGFFGHPGGQREPS